MGYITNKYSSTYLTPTWMLPVEQEHKVVEVELKKIALIHKVFVLINRAMGLGSQQMLKLLDNHLFKRHKNI